ncbi:HPP family protein [Pseudoalteromonas sp. SG44-8]|uniref:HPP family protein n=1 Tax=Pseudoalteromonas sp. SG44-8 TaxID=2760958 RepID=UPI001602C92D|nr:HPP family protein [Pseudoalteromonas sp. SG44-8]MBB1398381.1 HPP family protein [Pseudoalteromonas sp. SG44-8]
MRFLISRMAATSQCPPRKPMSKIMWSLIGSFLGIYLVAIIGKSLQFDPLTNLFLIGSLGATAVLVYGAPLAEFSQPRNLIGGHVLSALVGVTVAKLLTADLMLASALAVSLSVAVMHLTRTLHPPGGATALIAVIGGSGIQQLGYYYVVSPVLFGTTIMLLVGLLVNNLSRNPKRHYPVYWW